MVTAQMRFHGFQTYVVQIPLVAFDRGHSDGLWSGYLLRFVIVLISLLHFFSRILGHISLISRKQALIYSFHIENPGDPPSQIPITQLWRYPQALGHQKSVVSV